MKELAMEAIKGMPPKVRLIIIGASIPAITAYFILKALNGRQEFKN